jgi:hypothetical protein
VCAGVRGDLVGDELTHDNYLRLLRGAASSRPDQLSISTLSPIRGLNEIHLSKSDIEPLYSLNTASRQRGQKRSHAFGHARHRRRHEVAMCVFCGCSRPSRAWQRWERW